MVEIILTIVCSILGSSGVFTLILKRMEQKNAKTDMLLGLAHDRICFLGMLYLQRNPREITEEEYENLIDYLYEPYKRLGGNGTAEKIINDVKLKCEVVKILSIKEE